jgi:hypothetical protein
MAALSDSSDSKRLIGPLDAHVRFCPTRNDPFFMTLTIGSEAEGKTEVCLTLSEFLRLKKMINDENKRLPTEDTYL